MWSAAEHCSLRATPQPRRATGLHQCDEHRCPHSWGRQLRRYSPTETAEGGLQDCAVLTLPASFGAVIGAAHPGRDDTLDHIPGAPAWGRCLFRWANPLESTLRPRSPCRRNCPPPTERTQRTRRRVVQGDCADSQTRRLEPTSRPVGEHPQANTSPKGKRAEQAGRLSRLRLDESRSRQAWVTKSTQCVGCLKSSLCGGILLTDDPHASGPTRLTSRP